MPVMPQIVTLDGELWGEGRNGHAQADPLNGYPDTGAQPWARHGFGAMHVRKSGGGWGGGYGYGTRSDAIGRTGDGDDHFKFGKQQCGTSP